MEILWCTEVGSFMWGMNHPGSDHDYFSAYRVPTRDILSGRTWGGGAHFTPGPETGEDKQNHEIGKWISMLLAANSNYVQGIFSPIIVRPSPYLERLKVIMQDNLSTRFVPSLVGLAKGCEKDALRNPASAHKKYLTAIRSLKWGARILREGKISFEPVPADMDTPEAYAAALAELRAAEAATALPRDPPHPEMFHEFLLSVRMDELNAVGLDAPITAVEPFARRASGWCGKDGEA